MRVPQGARITWRLVNNLPQATSVHWHGIRIDNAMDGVAGLTQEPVEPGSEFLYDFTVPDAGTYWYHPHNPSWEQMARRLYGVLVVEEPEGAPAVDLDEVLLIDDWRLTDEARIADDFRDMHDWAHAGRIGNWITVNGSGVWTREVGQHSRLRLVNTANARIFTLETRGFKGWVVALEGMRLAVPERLDRLVLAPAQRSDLILDVTAEEVDEALLVNFESDGGYAFAGFPVHGSIRTERIADPHPLPPNPAPAPAVLDNARRVELLMEGAMGGMKGAVMDGRMMEMREMIGACRVWAFNGMAKMGREPLIEIFRNETVRIAIANDTAWPHAMHLHSHHFFRIAEDGTIGPLHDTLLIENGEVAEFAFVADNPGDWLLHCHMLEHSASGMMTWLRVT